MIEEKSDGGIFSVKFIKRSTGEVREMVCRKGVTKHLKGGEQSYDPKAKRLVTVFDMQKQAYRSINLDAVMLLKTEGVEYENSDFEESKES